MKLSRMIELALVHTYSEEKSWFLCNALEDLAVEHGLIDFNQVAEGVGAIEELMFSIDPSGHQPMVTALFHAGKVEKDSARNNMPYTTQLYIWWVFDLKNKGL